MSKVLLISKDEKIIAAVSEYLTSFDYKLYSQPNSKNLMLNIYRFNSKLIIIDLDNCDLLTIDIINSIKVQEYIPVMVLYSKNSVSSQKLGTISGFNIEKSTLAETFKNAVLNLIEFKEKYDNIEECYKTIDTINSETDIIFKQSIKKDHFSYSNSVESLLAHTFLSNKFLNNVPSIIMISSKNEGDTYIDVYYYVDNSIVKDRYPIVINDCTNLGIKVSIENKFYRNFDNEEFSDIDDYESIFEERLLRKVQSVNNFAAYNTTDTAVIAFNYKKRVSSFDENIIKGLCINFNLIKSISTQVNMVNDSFIYTVNALARAAEANDDDTGNHIKRVNEYSKLIAQNLGADKDYINTIYFSAQMHDVGKIHVPREILKKPGKLTDDEFDLIKQHTIFGATIIGDSPNLKMASEIALNHHEKYNGAGYPNRKSKEEIPLSARIVALADIYDALRSPRVYKAGFSHEETYNIITKGDGRVIPEHFDPQILEIFKKVHNQFNDINHQLG